MIKSLETTGRTEDEAIAAALKELGLERDDVSVTVVERAKSGFLGIGASPAVVRVEYEAPDEPEVEAEPAPVEAEAPVKAAEKPVDDGEFADIRAFLAGLLERMGRALPLISRERIWELSSAAGARLSTQFST